MDKSIWFLVLSSLIFYGYGAGFGIIVLFFSMFINYILAQNILVNKRAKALLAAGCCFNVLLLCLFKYKNILFGTALDFIKTPGISFYTFTGIALLCECYRGTLGSLSAREYTFLYTFFPKMLQGPIVLPEGMLSQKEGESISVEQVYRAIVLFVLGMFKKVIIADTLGAAVDFGYTNLPAMHTGESLVIILSYTLQLYFDFSGYCDMATALASLLGFELPLNFNSPYKAKDIGDFWDRWHITLTKFFTKYIYIPLGGNRKGSARTYLNILIVFLISGLWHGVGLGFIVWGLLHGVLSVVNRALKSRNVKSGFLSGVFTFLYVNAAWVFFRAPSVESALAVFKGVGECWFPRFNTGLAKCFNIDELWYVLKVLHADRLEMGIYVLMIFILVALLLLVFFAPTAIDYSKKCKINVVTSLFVTILFVWCVLSFEGVATYLYVNF